ncbi:MAG: tyrosine-type recombinase/integrase [Gammaproteobacteria bacterium]|jgi:integrase
MEAEKILIRRLAELEQEARRIDSAVFLFEEASMRYLKEIADKPSSYDIAMHLDQLFPFIGHYPIEQIHDGTLKPFIDHETARGKAPKSINNAIGIVSAILNKAARVWRTEDGSPWLKTAPARLSRLSIKGKQAKPYPLSWEEQDRLFRLLPRHLADSALYGINTGCRDQEICKLRWDWEVYVPELSTSVFILPEAITKTSTERVVVLNAVARSVIESRRGIHREFVFTYKGNPVARLNNSAWKRAWKKAGLPVEEGILKGVHNLRHSFGRRLRGAGVPLETRKALLGHANGDITTHYSAAELDELLSAVEKIVDRGVAQSPTLTVIKRSNAVVGNVSEKEKGLTKKVR